LVCVAKGLSSGYLPIGAVIAGQRVVDVLWAEDAGAFRHGYSYSGHPTACAVSLANLDILESEGLVAHVEEYEGVFEERLQRLKSHPLVSEVRTAGFLGGVELSAELLADAPDSVDALVVAARDHGLLVRNLLGKTIQVSPPLTIADPEIDFISSRLHMALDVVAAALDRRC